MGGKVRMFGGGILFLLCVLRRKFQRFVWWFCQRWFRRKSVVRGKVRMFGAALTFLHLGVFSKENVKGLCGVFSEMVWVEKCGVGGK